MRAARLVADTSYGTLRWVLHGDASWRAYGVGPSHKSSFCVSTRSTEATVVLEGEISIRFGPRDQLVRVRANEAVVVSQGMQHLCEIAPHSRFLVFDMPTPPDLSHGVAALPGGLLRAANLRSCDALWAAEPDAPLQLVSDAVTDYLALALGRFAAAEPIHSTRRMYKIKRDLEARYTERLTLAELSKRHRLDSYYLVRTFKRCFGIPPLQYVQYLRMEHFVWEALRSGHAGRSCSFLASDAGIGDYPTFSRKIRQRFGTPPSALVQVVR